MFRNIEKGPLMQKLNTGLMFWGIALTIELLCQWRERAGSLVAAFLEVKRGVSAGSERHRLQVPSEGRHLPAVLSTAT